MIAVLDYELLSPCLKARGISDPKIEMVPVSSKWNLPPEQENVGQTVLFFTDEWKLVFELAPDQSIIEGLYSLKPIRGVPYRAVRYIVIADRSMSQVRVCFPLNKPRFEAWSMELLYAKLILRDFGLNDPCLEFTPVDREWNIPPEQTLSNDAVCFFTPRWQCVLRLAPNQPIVEGLCTVKQMPGTAYLPVRYIVIVSTEKNTATVFFPKNQPLFDRWTMEQLYSRRTLR